MTKTCFFLCNRNQPQNNPSGPRTTLHTNQTTFESNAGNQSIAKALSDEEDSWSEPDVSASRKRMGISQHVLSLIEKNNKRMAGADSSEIEEQQKHRCKFILLIVTLIYMVGGWKIILPQHDLYYQNILKQFFV